MSEFWPIFTGTFAKKIYLAGTESTCGVFLEKVPEAVETFEGKKKGCYQNVIRM
jgi:hypothetical protein